VKTACILKLAAKFSFIIQTMKAVILPLIMLSEINSFTIQLKLKT